jgi:translocator protein
MTQPPSFGSSSRSGFDPNSPPPYSRTDRGRRKPVVVWLGLVVSLALAFLAAALGGWMTSTSLSTWYPGLTKPSWNPPDWVFGPVWTLLYTMMAVAAWLVWREGRGRDTTRALTFYGVQLFLNTLWSGLFFALQSPGAAVIEVVVFWLSILATVVACWRVMRWAGLLLVPYLAWVSFAAALNFAVWQLNR